MARPQNSEERSSYVAKGFIVGAAYDHLDAEMKLRFKVKSTGATYESTAKSTSATDLAGVKMGYASIPKNGVGISAGLTALKVNQSSDDGKTYYDIRGEGSLTLATELSAMTALYGFGGAHLNHMTDTSSAISDIGFGLQAGAGLGIGKNFSLELGYILTVHSIKDSALSSEDYEVDKTNSYVTLKGLIARATYNF